MNGTVAPPSSSSITASIPFSGTLSNFALSQGDHGQSGRSADPRDPGEAGVFPRTGRPARDGARVDRGTGQTDRGTEGEDRDGAGKDRTGRPLSAVQAEAAHQGVDGA